jgi:hypothetical protein
MKEETVKRTKRTSGRVCSVRLPCMPKKSRDASSGSSTHTRKNSAPHECAGYGRTWPAAGCAVG